MISDKAMLICLHITMWTARKHDKRVSEEVGPIRLVATELSTYKKSVRWTVVERERSFLEVLCGATEEPTNVREIFHTRSKRKC